MKCGFKMSKLTGNETIFDVKNKNGSLPEKYSYKNYLSNIIDQGETSLCVPYSLCAHLDWNYNVDHEGKIFKSNRINIQDIYDARKNKNDDNGMQIKEALEYLKEHGVKSKVGLMKIRDYGIVNNPLSLQYALLMNGPCIGALRVYNENTYFWRRDYEGQKMMGGHAIAIIGYNKEGFILRNTWGKSYGNNGYSVIPYEEFGKFLELWTIFD